VRIRVSLLIPTIALVAGLTACGDSAPNKADFTAKADGACTPGNTTISTTAKPANAAQVGTAAGTATTTVDSQVASLRAMKSPGGSDKAQVQGIITAIADVSGPTKALQDAAGKNDDAAMAQAAKDMQAKADAAHNSAQAYGLAQCGVQLKFGLGNLFDGVKNVVKASYAGKAEGLCRESIEKSDAVPEPGRNASLATAARYLDAQLVLSRKLATDFKALTTPPGDETPVADILASLDALNAKGQAVLDAIKANNPQLVLGLVDDVEVAGNALNAKLDAYGLKVCGTVSD
jgi:hypothetical protein